MTDPCQPRYPFRVRMPGTTLSIIPESPSFPPASLFSRAGTTSPAIMTPRHLPTLAILALGLAFAAPALAETLTFNPDNGLINGDTTLTWKMALIKPGAVVPATGEPDAPLVQEFLVLGDLLLEPGDRLTATDGSAKAVRLIVAGDTIIDSTASIDIAGSGTIGRAGGGAGGEGGTGGIGGTGGESFEADSDEHGKFWQGGHGADGTLAVAGTDGGMGFNNLHEIAEGGWELVTRRFGGGRGVQGFTIDEKADRPIDPHNDPGGPGVGGISGRVGSDALFPGERIVVIDPFKVEHVYLGATNGDDASVAFEGESAGFTRPDGFPFALAGGNGGGGGAGGAGGGGGGSGGAGGPGQEGSGGIPGEDGEVTLGRQPEGGAQGSGGKGVYGKKGGNGGNGGDGSVGSDGGAGGGAFEIVCYGKIVLDGTITAEGASSSKTPIPAGNGVRGELAERGQNPGGPGENGEAGEDAGVFVGGAGGKGAASGDERGGDGEFGEFDTSTFGFAKGGGGGGGGGAGGPSGFSARGADGGDGANGAPGGNGSGGTIILRGSAVTGNGNTVIQGGTGGYRNDRIETAQDLIGFRGKPGAFVVASNTAESSVPGVRAGTSGVRTYYGEGQRGTNIYWTENPQTPLLPTSLIDGIAHPFGLVTGSDRIPVPENAPPYAFAIAQRFDETEAFGADFVGFDGVAVQNLSGRDLDDYQFGEPTSSFDSNGVTKFVYNSIRVCRGVEDFEAAYEGSRDVGSDKLPMLPANTDWVTLVPAAGSRSVGLRATGFLSEGDLSDLGDTIFLISPKLQADVVGGTANLLIGASAQRDVTITNVNPDPARDLKVTKLEGNAVPSSFQPFTLAEEQSTTIGFSVVAATRGLITSVFHSNDVFEPVVEVLLGRAVAPESRLVDFPSLPSQLRAGQGISAQIVFANVGDGNLSGLGESSNLRGSIVANGSVGLDVQSTNDSINLADNETSIEPFTLRVLGTGESTFELGASFENGSQDGTNQPHTLTRTATISTNGPVPVIRWTDAEAAKQISDLESTGTLVIDSNATGGVPISISNEVANPLDSRDRLRIFSATLSGPDAGKFSLSGISNGYVIPTQTEDLTVTYTGGAATKGFATLTLSTDYLAPGGANTVGETYVFQLSALTGGRLITNTYVDQAGDFSPANPQLNDIVTWNPGGADAVSGLVFGVDAFTSVEVAAEAAEENGTVRIAEGTFSNGAVIEIGKSITIQGSGAGRTLLSGENSYRVLHLTEASAGVILSDLGIINGLAVVADENGSGGGILNLANLTIHRCQISGNLAKKSGGGIYNSGSLVVDSSTISGNTASNRPTTGAGLGGGVFNNGNLQLDNTTLSGNVSENDGGGINSQGDVVVSLNQCTVTKNVSRDLGGGIFITNAPATLTNCLVAGNTGAVANDHRGAIISQGVNFIGEPISASVTGPGPVLTFASTGTSLGGVLDSTLRDNGGPTLTHALVRGSPALDGGSTVDIPDGMTTDQRGGGFYRLRGLAVDLGAVETLFDTYVHAMASDFIITTDQGAAGLDAGDLVTWNGTSLGGSMFQLVFGVDAFTSIQSAVDATKSEATVHIAGGTYLEGEEVVISRNMKLSGDGANTTILSGANTHRVLRTPGVSNISLTISDLTVSEGAAASGGGFYSKNSDLNLYRLHFVGNTASDSGGAIALLKGRFRVYDCTFSNNSAVNGGAIWGDDSNARVFNTTFSGNTASENGGACYFPNYTVVIYNSTFAENSAGNFGGGVYNDAFGISMDNTILVGNTALEGPNAYSIPSRGEFISGEGNVVNLPESLSELSELLLPLGDYGGPTPTRALAPGSPAIEAGDNTVIPVEITADQRGFTRIFGSTVDAGAVEYGNEITTEALKVAVSPGLTVKIRIQDLIGAAGGGVGDPFNLVSITSPGNAGSSTRISGNFIVYQAAPGQTGMDRFTYVLSDGTRTTTGTIQVNPQDAGDARTLNIVSIEVGAQAVIRAAGVPGMFYQIEHTDDLSPADWAPMGGQVQCPAGGIMEFTDPGPMPDKRFYRVGHVAEAK